MTRHRSTLTELSRAAVFSGLNSEFSNLEPREYVPQYNPLRLFHVAASKLPKHCQTFVAVCFYPSTDWDILGRYQRSEKNLAERAARYFLSLAVQTSITLIFFHRTHLPFMWLPCSNAHWFSGRLLTRSMHFQSSSARKKFFFILYICILTSLSFPPSLFPFLSIFFFPFYLSIYLSLSSFNRVFLQQSNTHE